MKQITFAFVILMAASLLAGSPTNASGISSNSSGVDIILKREKPVAKQANAHPKDHAKGEFTNLRKVLSEDAKAHPKTHDKAATDVAKSRRLASKQ